jgi:hypothetical protein
MASAGMAGVKEKISGLFRKGGKGGGGKKLKLTNIVESIDVGVPVSLAYNQWTQYNDFPKFTKKVESAEKNRNEEQKVNWKAQVFWSHRTWEATVVEQVPDERIVWRSKGQKGHVDGAVTFHELGPSLTRILLVLEYHPQGLFEHTGNIWRAQGRRARLELKHFQRHLMTQGILHRDDIEGWRGTIHDGELTESHEDALEREQEGSDRDGSRQADDGRLDDEARGQDDDEARGQDDDEARGQDESDVEAGEDERADAEVGEDGEADTETAGRRGGQRTGQAASARRTSQSGSSRSGASRGRTSRASAGQGTGRRRAGATVHRGGNT